MREQREHHRLMRNKYSKNIGLSDQTFVLQKQLIVSLETLRNLHPEIAALAPECDRLLKLAVRHPAEQNIKALVATLQQMESAIHRRSLFTPVYYFGFGVSALMLCMAGVMMTTPSLFAVGVVLGAIGFLSAAYLALNIPVDTSDLRQTFFSRANSLVSNLNSYGIEQRRQSLDLDRVGKPDLLL